MRVAIVSNLYHSTLKVRKKLENLLKEKKEVIIDQENPELVISIGGDGTLLAAFHEYCEQIDTVQFVGIHTGHLGFYTDWLESEMKDFVDNLRYCLNEVTDYPLLEVKITCHEGEENEQYLALNESTIRRFSSTLVSDVYISGTLFESFRGDGLSISTPTGSTAFNKSVGGAVIHPSVNALQLAEIASLNNRVFRTLGSPLVIGKEEWITIQLKDFSDYVVSVDQLVFEKKNIASISYKISDKRIRFANMKHMHFWERVKQAFIGENNEI